MDNVMTDQLMLAGDSKKKVSKLFLLFIFVTSFLFFLYLTFPYNVVKEYLASEVSKQAGINLVIGELRPSFPIGLSVRNVEVSTSTGGGMFRLSDVNISLSILSLFTGKVGANISLGASQGGSMDIFANLGLGQIFSGDIVPSSVELEAQKFPIDGLANFGIAMAARNAGQSGQTGGILGEFIKKLRLGGELNGNIDMDLEPSDLAQSSGSLKIGLEKGFFWLDDAALNIAKQNFNKANIAANFENSKLNIDKSSGFVSQELELLFSGFIQLKQSLATSLIEVKVDLTLKDSLQRAIGFLLDRLTGGQEGRSKFILRGPLLNPQRVQG